MDWYKVIRLLCCCLLYLSVPGSLGFPTATHINSTAMTTVITGIVNIVHVKKYIHLSLSVYCHWKKPLSPFILEGTATTIPAECTSILSSLSSAGLLSIITLSFFLVVFLIANTVLCCHYRRRYGMFFQFCQRCSLLLSGTCLFAHPSLIFASKRMLKLKGLPFEQCSLISLASHLGCILRHW